MFGFVSEKTKLKKENAILKAELAELRNTVDCISRSADKLDNKLFDIQVAFNKGVETCPSMSRYTVIKRLNEIING